MHVVNICQKYRHYFHIEKFTSICAKARSTFPTNPSQARSRVTACKLRFGNAPTFLETESGARL